jgi:hypothetical protein
MHSSRQTAVKGHTGCTQSCTTPRPGSLCCRQKGRAVSAAEEDEEEEGSEGDASMDWESDAVSAAASMGSQSLITGSSSDGCGGSGSGIGPAAGSGSGGTNAGSGGAEVGSGSVQGGTLRERGWNKVEVRWSEERDPRDPVVRRHYR